LSGKKSVVRTARAQEKRRVHNRVVRGQTRNTLRAMRAIVATGDSEQTQAAVVSGSSMLDRAVSKGVFHKNKAARLKSRLAKRANAAVAAKSES
jgi:small subunit ribosomal protein S20